MQVQVNTDRNVDGNEELRRQVESVVDGVVGRFGDQVTRVEVHLSDENSSKAGGDDKRCVMEARLAGLRPVAVSHQAPTIWQAVDGAAERLEKLLDSTLGRLEDKGR